MSIEREQPSSREFRESQRITITPQMRELLSSIPTILAMREPADAVHLDYLQLLLQSEGQESDEVASRRKVGKGNDLFSVKQAIEDLFTLHSLQDKPLDKQHATVRSMICRGVDTPAFWRELTYLFSANVQAEISIKGKGRSSTSFWDVTSYKNETFQMLKYAYEKGVYAGHEDRIHGLFQLIIDNPTIGADIRGQMVEACLFDLKFFVAMRPLLIAQFEKDYAQKTTRPNPTIAAYILSNLSVQLSSQDVYDRARELEYTSGFYNFDRQFHRVVGEAQNKLLDWFGEITFHSYVRLHVYRRFLEARRDGAIESEAFIAPFVETIKEEISKALGTCHRYTDEMMGDPMVPTQGYEIQELSLGRVGIRALKKYKKWRRGAAPVGRDQMADVVEMGGLNKSPDTLYEFSLQPSWSHHPQLMMAYELEKISELVVGHASDMYAVIHPNLGGIEYGIFQTHAEDLQYFFIAAGIGSADELSSDLQHTSWYLGIGKCHPVYVKRPSQSEFKDMGHKSVAELRLMRARSFLELGREMIYFEEFGTLIRAAQGDKTTEREKALANVWSKFHAEAVTAIQNAGIDFSALHSGGKDGGWTMRGRLKNLLESGNGMRLKATMREIIVRYRHIKATEEQKFTEKKSKGQG